MRLDRQLTRVERPDGLAVDMGYDAAGRLSSVTLPNGTVTYGYSPATGQVTSVAAPGGTALSYTYDGALPTSVT